MSNYRKIRFIISLSAFLCLSFTFLFADVYSYFDVTKRVFWRFFAIFYTLPQSSSDIIQQNQIQEQAIYQSLYQEVLEDNQRLSKLLNITAHLPYKNIVHAVLNRFESTTFFNKIWINKGSEDGIQKYDPVLSMVEQHVPPFAIIGYIVEIFKNESQIMLISDPSSRIVVSLNNFPCLLKGIGYFKARIDYFDVGIDFKEDTLVRTSAYSKIFPKGLVIGYAVLTSLKSKKEGFQNIQVKPLMQLNSIQEVMVLSHARKKI